MYLYSEWRGECFEDDDNDGLYHPNQQTREQERAGQEVHTVRNPIGDFAAFHEGMTGMTTG